MKIKAIGVQFISGIKVYDFDPGENKVSPGDSVLVETTQGKEVGKVIYVGKEVKEEKDGTPIKEIIKVLGENDKAKLKEVRKKGTEDLIKFEKVIEKHELPMKAILVEYNIFEERADLYFISDGRVDFRNAVKDLSRVFQMNVRLRQVGSRDQAKILGGYGPCGREVCCKRFLAGLGDISREKLTAEFGGKNVGKITGICGNLMCCLNFEKKSSGSIGENSNEKKEFKIKGKSV